MYESFHVVEAIETFDHDPFNTEVVAPNLFEKFGVVNSFNNDPRGPGYPRFRVRYGDRT